MPRFCAAAAAAAAAVVSAALSALALAAARCADPSGKVSFGKACLKICDKRETSVAMRLSSLLSFCCIQTRGMVGEKCCPRAPCMGFHPPRWSSASPDLTATPCTHPKRLLRRHQPQTPPLPPAPGLLAPSGKRVPPPPDRRTLCYTTFAWDWPTFCGALTSAATCFSNSVFSSARSASKLCVVHRSTHRVLTTHPHAQDATYEYTLSVLLVWRILMSRFALKPIPHEGHRWLYLHTRGNRTHRLLAACAVLS